MAKCYGMSQNLAFSLRIRADQAGIANQVDYALKYKIHQLFPSNLSVYDLVIASPQLKYEK